MAEPVVSFLLENIGRLLAEEAQFLGGVRGQAQLLQTKLALLLALLRDADLRQDERAAFRVWISQSKEVAYDAEDALETFAFQVASRKGKGIAKFLKRYSCILSECCMRHRVGSKIQNLHGIVSELTERFHGRGISASTEEGPSSRQPPLLFRRTYSHVMEDDFVALEDDVELLVQKLTSEDEVSPRTVVSICGMGGLGKTTIAIKVYHHPNVRRHFGSFAWVCISQQWQTKDILHGILVKIVPEKREELKQLTEDELVGHLYEVQKSKKCLIVLDDIWSRDAWDHLKNAFPTTERSGSKILVTTRIKDVATYIGPSGFHHEPRLLTDDESWELLQKKAGQRSHDHEPVVSFLLKNIGGLLAEEAQFLGGVRGQAQQLQTKLALLLALLRDADLRQDERAAFRVWISQSKEVAYDAEDALETFAFQVASRKGKGIAKFLKRYSCILSECYMRHRLGSEIQNLHGRISELTKSFHYCGISAATKEGPSSRQPPLLFRRTYSHVMEDDFVALEDDVELLVQKLTSEDEVSPRTVVSICGMGGLGKTTIAKKVYRHLNVRRHFGAFAWICISQQWQAKDILQKILVKIMPKNSEQILKWTDEQLVSHLCDIQQKKKCLVVLDDIWSTDAWDHLKAAFPTPERSSGSKILVTTRNKDVAAYIGPSDFRHEPELLNDDESWELLQKKAGQLSHDHGFEDLGKEIAKCSGGLPLAVVVIGGILATKHQLHEWQFVHQNVKSLLEKGEKIGGGGGDFQKILALSYNDLPYHLKPCFLYLSIYPEDCDIATEELYHLWMAEGMVSKEDRIGNESMMDVAERYLGELIERCMIQVTLHNDGPALRKFKSCRLHDLMRDLCLAKARDENFLKVVDYREENIDQELEDSHSSSGKCRRIAIFLNEEDVSKYVPPEKEMMKHARSLTVRRFGSFVYEGRMASTKFNNFKMLRALTIEGMLPDPGDKLSDIICRPIQIFKLEIGNLIHLRYLRLITSFFFMLPSSLGNLQHLETLDLRGAKLVLVRNVLFKMKNLKHLYLFNPYDDIDFFYDHLPRCCKLQLSSLTRLEILENLNSKYCVLEGLCKLKSLQVLKVLTTKLENDCEKIINCISDSQRLKEARVNLDMDEDFLNSEKWLTLLDKLFCSNLCHLSLEGTIRVLPEYKTNFFRNLVELRLGRSRIEKNLMGTLENLLNLQSLWLMGAAFVGTEIICSSNGFPQLTFLSLHVMRHLREWKVEDGAMPNLSCLKIENCPHLEMIPDGFRFLRKLKELGIRRMPERFTYRIRNANGEGVDFDKEVVHGF